MPRVDETEKHQLLPNDGFHDAKPPADTADDPKAESDGDKSAQGDSGPGGQVIISTPVEEADDSTISGNG